jgi:tetratricopeptide (TPR) repeat protein
MDAVTSPTEPQVSALLRAWNTRGVDCLDRRNRPVGEYHLSRALYLIEDLEDRRERRDQYRVSARLLVQADCPELAEKAILAAIDLDRQLDDVAALVNDQLDYGNALGRLDRVREAADVYQQCLDLSLRHGWYASAASASTNLGAIHVDDGAIDRGRAAFLESLDYLARESHPDTEMRTRLNLLMLYEHLGAAPEESFAIARGALDRLGAELSGRLGHFRRPLEDLLARALARHFEAHPTTERDAWLLQHFPEMRSPERRP